MHSEQRQETTPDQAAALPADLAEAVEHALFRSDRPCAAIAKLGAAHPEHAAAILALQHGFELPRTGITRAAPPRADDVASDTRQADRIGPYRLDSVLGEGGMGTVYLAHQTEPVRRSVALKVVRLGIDRDDALARFELERRALAAMNHNCIAKAFDAGTTACGQPWFAMEHVDGVPITDYCRRHGLTVAERVELFRRVCAGVQHAHQQGIIHRDLKPGNILVTHESDGPVPKVLDFGLAKAIDGDRFERSMLTCYPVAMGTPEYMAPEQATGIPERIDTRADVFSLGVVLYELLAGSLPFDWERVRAGGWSEIQRVLHHEDAPRPSTRASSRTPADEARPAARSTGIRARELRGDLDWIVMKAMAREPARRYASAAELAEDLRRSLAHRPVHAGPPSASYLLQKFVRRYRVPILASAMVLFALLAIGIGTHAHYLHTAQRVRHASADDATARPREHRAKQATGGPRAAELSTRPGHADPLLARIDLLIAIATAADEQVALLREKMDSLAIAGQRAPAAAVGARATPHGLRPPRTARASSPSADPVR